MRRSPLERGIDSARLLRWYDAQARFYSLWRDDHDGALVRSVAERLPADRPLRILDAGCGTGLFSIGLALRAEAWRVVGLDASRGMLDVARAHAGRRKPANAFFSRGSVYALPFPAGCFDLVCSASLLPNLNDAPAALAEFRRVLGPAGELVVVEIDRDALTAIHRLLFRTLIFGQRLIAAVLPRFRFARRWSLERSTVDRAELESALRERGFGPVTVASVAEHLIFRAPRDA